MRATSTRAGAAKGGAAAFTRFPIRGIRQFGERRAAFSTLRFGATISQGFGRLGEREGFTNLGSLINLCQPADADPGQRTFLVQRPVGACGMGPDFFRKFAERVRGLSERVRTEAAREQLQIWAAEFEAHAASLDTQSPARDGPINSGERK